MNSLALIRDGMIDGLAGLLRTPQHQPRTIRPHTTVCHNGTVTYGVTIDGESYECSERELAMLRAGLSPAALELSPWENSDDYAGTAWDREASAGDRDFQLRKEQA